MENKKVRVATRCFIFKDNKIVAIKYKDKGDKTGYYDLPGGKIEEGETPEECAKRECIEETGIIVNDFKYSGNLILEYPERIFDISAFIANNYIGNFIDNKENTTELIEIKKLIKENKILGHLKLLEEKYINDIKYCTNFKYLVKLDNNENIIEIVKEK